jgi:UDP-N-acetylmuramate dehydrogenase
MSIAENLRRVFPALKTQEILAKRTTLGVGGPAEYFADVSSLPELVTLRKAANELKLPVFFLGSGSNLLISDRGIAGLVIHLQGDFRKIEFQEQEVKVGAGVMMPMLAKQAAEKGLSGVESLIGVPGTIGGGLVMNAGTREGWLGHVVKEVDLLNPKGQVETVAAAACEFNYRSSALEQRWVVGARLQLKKDDPVAVAQRMNALLEYRARTQPLATSNCGSVFKNPTEGPAAQWIEKAGLKGTLQVGRARVSDRHANFIITENGATASHVDELIQKIQEKVFADFHVRLEPEVKRVGVW